MGTIADILLGVCSHRTISAPTFHSFETLRLARLQGGFPIDYSVGLFVGDALLGRARSQAVSRFLDETQIPFFLFIDDDIVFSPVDIQKIYDSLKKGYDLIGGIYPVRGASQLSSYGWGGQLPINGQIIEIEYLATGFMGISRRLLEKIRTELQLPLLNPNDWSRNYPFFESGRYLDRPVGDKIYISEDWDFCEKARKVGVKCYADTSVQLGHMREDVYTPNHVRELQMKQLNEQAIFGSMKQQQELMMSVDTDISEFIGKPIPEVQKMMGKPAQTILAEMWGKSPANFYNDNEIYLYDLADFNKTPGYWQGRVNQLVNINNVKMLDIGCGIGTLVFMMAGQENEVVGWDINKKCIDFCNFKKNKYQLKGDFTLEKPDLSQFDLVTAIDTLEHIEDLQGFLKDLGAGLRKGAKFYHSDYFPRDNTWPMHYEENAQHLNEWLEEAGFTIWDSNWAIRG